MATINKKLIHFRSLSDFEARLAAGDILSTSIVWIKDAKKIWTHGTYYDCNGGETLTEADILAMGFTKNAGTITGVSANGTSVATSGVANIPAASTSKYGVTKLSSATNSTSTTLAATPSAVKAAYDLANSYKGTVTGVKINGNAKSPSSGVVDLGTVITSHQDISGKQDKLVSGTNIKTVNGQSLLGSGDITINGGSGSGSGSYVPMSNTWYDSPSSVTVAPNSSAEISDLGLTSITINLTEPTDNSVVNTYTLIIRKFGFGNAFTFDKTIFWANDNPPIFDTSEDGEIVEISIKKINSYVDGYLGTWAKYSV